MTLFRGCGGDLPLMRWLREMIWPVEAKLEPDDVYWGTRLACAEMIRSGTTRFWDMYWHPVATRPRGARRRAAGDDRRAAPRRRRQHSGDAARRRWSDLDALAELGPEVVPHARAARDLHGQRGAAALDGGAGGRARAAGPDPPLRDRAGGERLPRAARRCGPPPTSTGSGCWASAPCSPTASGSIGPSWS